MYLQIYRKNIVLVLHLLRARVCQECQKRSKPFSASIFASIGHSALPRPHAGGREKPALGGLSSDSSAWIRTRDLTIMSRARAVNGDDAGRLTGKKRLQIRHMNQSLVARRR
jgi:hypothetical protein